MIVSPSLPPIPGKVIDKVRAGLFVDLREMFPDNAALTKQITETGGSSAGSKLRELEDPLTWAFYFLAFLAVSVNDSKAKELAAYGQIVIQLAQRHGGRGWLSYDRLFRQQAAAGSDAPWNEIAPSLMAATVMAAGPSKGNSCQLCNGADHQTSACALLPSSSQTQSSKQDNFSYKRQRTPSAEPCKRFNRNECYQSPMTCKFTHCCLACGSLAHPVVACPKYRGGQPQSQVPVSSSMN